MTIAHGGSELKIENPEFKAMGGNLIKIGSNFLLQVHMIYPNINQKKGSMVYPRRYPPFLPSSAPP